MKVSRIYPLPLAEKKNQERMKFAVIAFRKFFKGKHAGSSKSLFFYPNILARQ